MTEGHEDHDMTFWEGPARAERSFPFTIHFGRKPGETSDASVTLHADGSFDGDPVALRRYLTEAHGWDGIAGVLCWLLLAEMERPREHRQRRRSPPQPQVPPRR